ncbi:MAG TPA: response regulator [Dehalococcoidia bacterium]|nr:response regulator [Dehalococcoidia bacterium]
MFINLIINAEDEMKQAYGKGNLSIRTERIDDNIRVSFKDDGPGIPKENLDRIFEPFFTTKKVGEGTGAKILVVDDELGVLQFLSRLLAEEGYEVDAVDNTGDALEKIKKERYNLVLLDIKMPDMSGIEIPAYPEDSPVFGKKGGLYHR